MIPEQSALSTDLDWMMQSHQVSDAQLIRFLMSEYHPMLFGLARSITDEAGQASAAVENTLIEAVGARRRFWGNTTLKAWLVKLLIRHCWDIYKGKTRLSKLRLTRLGANTVRMVTPGLDLDQLSAEHRSLWERIQHFSSQDIFLLLLRYVHGLTATELAYVLKVKESTILFRLRGLRQKIGIWPEPAPAGYPSDESSAGHCVYQQQLQAAFDRALEEEEHRQLKQHVMVCPQCRAYSAALALFDEWLRQSLRLFWPVEQGVLQDSSPVVASMERKVEKIRQYRRLSRFAREAFLVVVAILVVLGLSSVGNLTETVSTPAPPSANMKDDEVSGMLQTPVSLFPTPTYPYDPRWRSDYLGVHESLLGVLNSEGVLGAYLNFPVRREYLRFSQNVPGVNLSGSVNLYYLLYYWGERRNPQAYLQPNSEDETVMFYEMVQYIEDRTDLSALVRMGGDIETIKSLIEAGIPVMVQKGYDNLQPDGWAGHYVIVNGYDELNNNLILLGTFPEDGGDTPMAYHEFLKAWRAFNYAYLIAYPEEQAEQVRAILGEQADEVQNYRFSAEKARSEIKELSSKREQFFAWYNLGTSLTYLENYAEAKDAFEKAFAVYLSLPQEERPWRILWYQTRPYWAFFYTGSYQMVIDLATSTLESGERPLLEESYYWRGLAREALGDLSGAIQDLNEAIRMNPNFLAGKYQLRRIKGES